MARQPDYYKTLGVDKKASQEDIKKAYRKLARRYHPDQNKEKGAEDRVKKVLRGLRRAAGPEKRKRYDRGSLFPGGAPYGGGGAGGGATASDFGSFSEHPVQDLSARGGAKGNRTKPATERGRDLDTTVSLSFEQAVDGAQVPVSGGDGLALPDLPRDGRRARHPARRLPRLPRPRGGDPGPGAVLHHPPVRALRRSGNGHREALPHLRGRRAHAGAQEVPRVNIPAGVKDGSRIRLAGKGEAGIRGGPSGDLFVITHVGESPVFVRKGDNLEVEVPITVPEALGGADVEVPTLHGTKTPAGAARAPATGPCSGCAARARPCRGLRQGATSTTGS